MAEVDLLGDELISCSICLEHFKSPKTLNCLHTFCEACLCRHLAATLAQRQDLIMHPPKIPCPTCREVTIIPDSGISGLRTDFKLISKITEFLQQVSAKDTRCDVCRTVRREEEAAFHCRDCNKHFCTDCIYRHNNTEVFDAHAVKEMKKGKLNKMICKDHEEEMESIRYFCQSCEQPICTLCAMTEHMLHNLTDLDAGKARHQRCKKMRAMLDKVESKCDQLQSFLNKLEMFGEKLHSSKDETAEKIRERSKTLIQHVRDQEMDLLNSLDKQFHAKIEHVTNEKSNVQHCKKKLDDLRTTTAKALDDENDTPFFGASNVIIKDLKQAVKMTFLDPEDFKEVDAGFDLTFPKDIPNIGQLGENNISSNLQFMSRVPIHIVAKISNSHLDWPSDVDFMADGCVIVADTENYQLKMYDSQGNFKMAMATGEVKPAGVAVTRVRTIVVTDILDRCVKIFDEIGKQIFQFGQEVFHSPAGIAVNSYGEYIVSDIGNHCVTIHNSQGNMLAQLGSFGCTDTMFDCPWYVATNDQNDIIVADMGNKCVKIFNYDLHLVAKIEDPETMLCPSGIHTDLQGNLLVCDSGSNLVSMFTPEGQFITNLLTEDDGIDGPHGIAVGAGGQLALMQCNSKNPDKHEVRLYQLYE